MRLMANIVYSTRLPCSCSLQLQPASNRAIFFLCGKCCLTLLWIFLTCWHNFKTAVEFKSPLLQESHIEFPQYKKGGEWMTSHRLPEWLICNLWFQNTDLTNNQRAWIFKIMILQTLSNCFYIVFFSLWVFFTLFCCQNFDINQGFIEAARRKTGQMMTGCTPCRHICLCQTGSDEHVLQLEVFVIFKAGDKYFKPCWWTSGRRQLLELKWTFHKQKILV